MGYPILKTNQHTIRGQDPTADVALRKDEKPSDYQDGQATSVYYLHSSDHELLYVGITSRYVVRLAEHARDKNWWSEVGYASFEHFDTRVKAELREAAAIKQLEPRYNKRQPVAPSTAPLRPSECVVHDCDRRPRAKGLCEPHYRKQWRESKQ